MEQDKENHVNLISQRLSKYNNSAEIATLQLVAVIEPLMKQS
jgi:hypothetical protein